MSNGSVTAPAYKQMHTLAGRSLETPKHYWIFTLKLKKIIIVPTPPFIGVGPMNGGVGPNCYR